MFGRVVVSAFAGFQLFVSRTRAVAIWAVTTILAGLAVTLGLAAVLPAGSPRAPISPGLWAVFITVGLLVLVFSVCLICAVHRAILRPSEQARAYVRLGPDELRMFLVGVLLAAAGLVCWIVGFLGVTLMTTLGFPRLLAALIPLGLALFVAPRLVLVGATSFARRSLDVSEAWDLGGQHYWSLLIMCLLVGGVTAGLLLAQVVIDHVLPSAGLSLPARLALAIPNALIASLLDLVVFASAPAAFLALKGRPRTRAAAFE